MLPLPYTQPVASALFWGLCLVFLVGEALVTARSRQRGGDDPSGADRGAKSLAVGVIALVLVVAFAVAAILPGLAITPRMAGVRWTVCVLGLAVLACGIALRQ